jgi:hypothetical protein
MKNIMKAGIYYVGDPCYVFNSNEWDGIYDQFGDVGIGEVKGSDVWSSYTKWGDGKYWDSINGKSYLVDSGTIGAVPVEIITEKIDKRSMNIVEFENDFECSYSNTNGTITIGHIKIKTA